MAALPDRSPFVGRDAEFSDAVELLRRVAGGQSGLLSIMGEAGVGKSRFVSELRRYAQKQDWWAFVGRCTDLEVGQQPYGPVAQGLRALHDLGVPMPAVIEPDLGLRELFTIDTGGMSESRARLQAFETVLDKLTAASLHRPLLLILEDVHWVDSSTLDLVRFLSQNLRRKRVLIVLTYRIESDLGWQGQLGPVLGELFRLPNTARIELTRFGRDQLEEFATQLLGRPVEPGLLDRLAEQSDGNPFFAEEMLSSAQFVARGELPQHLSMVVRARLPELSRPSLAVVRAAATIGRETSGDLLAEVAGLPEEDAAQALGAAVGAGVLVQAVSGGYAFRHALVKDVVYRDLLIARPLHRAVARALEHQYFAAEFQPATAAEVAAHWYLGGDLAAALRAAIHAGRLAVKVHAFAEAAGQFEQAVKLWDAVPADDRPTDLAHVDLLGLAAEAARWTGNLERAVELGAMACAEVADGPPGRVVLLLGRLGVYHWEAGDSEGSLSAYEQARRLLPKDDRSRAMARILGGQAHMLNLRGRFQESIEVAEQAVELARELGAVGEESYALCTIGTALGMLGDYGGAVPALRRARVLAEQVNSMEDVCRAITNLSDILDFSGQLEEAAAVAEDGYAMTVRHHMELNAGGVMLGNAVSALRRLGRWQEAQQLAEPVVDRAPAGIAPPLHVSLGAIALAAGHLDTARKHAQAAERLCVRNTDPQLVGPVYGLLAELALAERDVGAALAAIDAGLAALAGSEEDHLVVRLCAVALRGFADHGATPPGVAARHREPADYLDLAEKAVAVLAERGTPFPEAEANLLLARAENARGEAQPEPDLWRAAVERWVALGQPYPSGYARYRLAEALAATAKSRVEAAEVSLAAYREATALGAGPLAAEIEALRRRTNLHKIAPPDDSPPQPDEVAEKLAPYKLTPRERQVLELLVSGLSNRLIGRRLRTTEKTASVHVSNLIGKLGVTNRTQAATRGRALGIESQGEAETN